MPPAKKQAVAHSLNPSVNSQPENHAQMHADHLAWASDIANWLDDIVLWQAELRHVVEGMKQWQMTLEELQQSLVKQSVDISTHQQALRKHEHALAGYEQGNTASELIGLSCKHQEEKQQHEAQRSCHEAAKQWHRSIMSNWEHLHKAIFGMPST